MHGGFVAQWFMVALVRHPGFESRSCRFFAFLLSLSAGWIPINVHMDVFMYVVVILWLSHSGIQRKQTF